MAENKMERANRIAIQTTEEGYKADFYRTHKKLATLFSEETQWVADESMNKSAQREDFRKFAIEHADMAGILWNPADLRTDSNKRIPKYENDGLLIEDTTKLLWDDLWNLAYSCYPDLEWKGIAVDGITPMAHSAKGTDLSKLGITEGKYNSTGNWAWAEIEVTLTLAKGEQEIYFMTKAQLVSGQLKKPHITKTSFTDSVKESLKEAGLWEEEAKADGGAEDSAHLGESAKAETPAEVEVQEEVKAEPKAKKSRSKKTSKKEDTAE